MFFIRNNIWHKGVMEGKLLHFPFHFALLCKLVNWESNLFLLLNKKMNNLLRNLRAANCKIVYALVFPLSRL